MDIAKITRCNKMVGKNRPRTLKMLYYPSKGVDYNIIKKKLRNAPKTYHIFIL